MKKNQRKVTKMRQFEREVSHSDLNHSEFSFMPRVV